MSSQKPSETETESELEPFYMLNINEDNHPISTLAASVIPQSEKEKEPEKEPDSTDNEVEALSNNKVGVEIEPDVKANRVSVQICSCSLIFNCFSPNR
jgi:hypothetical protein